MLVSVAVTSCNGGVFGGDMRGRAGRGGGGGVAAAAHSALARVAAGVVSSDLCVCARMRKRERVMGACQRSCLRGAGGIIAVRVMPMVAAVLPERQHYHLASYDQLTTTLITRTGKLVISVYVVHSARCHR